jgi:hypothetical protein
MVTPGAYDLDASAACWVVLACGVLSTALLLVTRFGPAKVPAWRREPEQETLLVGGIPTAVLWIRGETRAKTLYVLLPGNPGLVTFNATMLDELHNASGRTVDAVVVGHAGHCARHQPAGRLYTLEEQVAHKVAFIREHAKAYQRLVIAGHSVGAYMCTRLQRAFPPSQFHQVQLLMPTFEFIAASPNGVRLTPVFRYLRPLGSAVAGALGLLPRSLKRTLVRYAGGVREPDILEAAIDLFDRHFIANLLFLAEREMAEIKEPDMAVLLRDAPKMVFYFSPSDEWSPPPYYERTKAALPDARVLMCDKGSTHSFQVDAGGSALLGRLAWRWISEAEAAEKF